jgi:hypothetical protein
MKIGSRARCRKFAPVSSFTLTTDSTASRDLRARRDRLQSWINSGPARYSGPRIYLGPEEIDSEIEPEVK